MKVWFLSHILLRKTFSISILQLFIWGIGVQEAEKEVSLVSEERDKALQDLHDALANHDKELAERQILSFC